MRRELEAFVEAGRKLVDAWDEDSVVSYPSALPSMDELVMMISAIDVRATPESSLTALMKLDGLWDDDSCWIDGGTDAIFIGGRGSDVWLGIDYGINGEWSVYLYWYRGDDEQHFSRLDTSPDGLNFDPVTAKPGEVFYAVKPLVLALREGEEDARERSLSQV